MIKTDASRGTFEDILAGKSPLIVQIAHRLRDGIEKVYPGVTECLVPVNSMPVMGLV